MVKSSGNALSTTASHASSFFTTFQKFKDHAGLGSLKMTELNISAFVVAFWEYSSCFQFLVLSIRKIALLTARFCKIGSVTVSEIDFWTMGLGKHVGYHLIAVSLWHNYWQYRIKRQIPEELREMYCKNMMD